jgi:hypothetical protein
MSSWRYVHPTANGAEDVHLHPSFRRCIRKSLSAARSFQANVAAYNEFNRGWQARAQSCAYPAKLFKTASLRKVSPATVK